MTRQTGRRALNTVATALVKSVAGLSDAELRMARRRIRSLTETNCWWVEYSGRDLFSQLVENEILFRRRQKRRDRATARKVKS